MKKHLLILSTLVLVSGKIFAADGSVSVENQTGKDIKIQITDSILDLKKLGTIPSATGDSKNYAKTGELTIKNNHQWKVPTKKTKRTVTWIINNKKYETTEAYNPLDGIVIYDDGKTYSVKKSAIGSFSKKIDSKEVKTSKQEASKTKPAEKKPTTTKTKETIKEEIKALEKEFNALDKELKSMEEDYKKLPKEDKNKASKKFNETKTIVTSAKVKILAEIAKKQAELF
ncbi:MAG: hypothetical protein UR12_C0010G0044 [candidate division TM6 bacterium GW2011_GWF2_30_66]|jgi:hypothetical protein|nr:MAG: hypothetical protein UR12_C0010G0044 [candidate division TM6 bacterium GW2011_GWF2_30_66]